jgi:hypothetical protein
MIKNYEELKAQREEAIKKLEMAKLRLTEDTNDWKEEVKPLGVVTSVAENLFTNKVVGKGAKGLLGNGIQLGFNAVMAKTALRRLPTPLNIIVPQVLQNVTLNYIQEHGRDWLIAGLRWFKKVTESDEPNTELLVPAVEDPTLPKPH